MMSALFNRRAAELAEIGRSLHQRGWVPATSGNFSMRLDANSAIVTASGRHKGLLNEGDFLAVDLEGRPLPGSANKPSAETLLHTQLYAWQPWVDTVLHCHSPNATLASRFATGDTIELADYELLKAFRGIATHATTVSIPIFENSQDISVLAAQVETYLAENPNCPAYLIRGHGVYAWGENRDECLRHLDALDFLLHCELQAAHLRGGNPR